MVAQVQVNNNSVSQALLFSPEYADPEPRARRLARVGFGHERTEESVEWYTPPEIFDALDLDFDLDPAAPKGGVPWVPAWKHYSKEENGLRQQWDGRVWLNPPYGDETATWLARLAVHGTGVALVFARTDVRWFHEIATGADALLFTAGRVRFIRPDGTRGMQTGAGSLLIAYGAHCAEKLRASGLGWVAK